MTIHFCKGEYSSLFGNSKKVRGFYSLTKGDSIAKISYIRLVGKLDLYKFWDLKYCPYGHR